MDEPAQDDDRKPAARISAFAVTVFLILLVAYPLSIGPAATLSSQSPPWTRTHTNPPADKPIEAQLARPPRWWQRLLALSVPTVAGACLMSGIGCIYGGNWLVALVFVVIAGVGLRLAWGWTR